MHPQINRYLLYEMMDKQTFQPIFDELMSRQVLYIHEENNTAMGTCKLAPLTYRNAHIVYLGGVAVHPSFAGKGRGFTMLKEIIEYAKEQGFLRIELSVASENEKAIHLYKKAGFAEEGLLRKYTYLQSENKFLDEVMMSYLV